MKPAPSVDCQRFLVQTLLKLPDRSPEIQLQGLVPLRLVPLSLVPLSLLPKQTNKQEHISLTGKTM